MEIVNAEGENQLWICWSQLGIDDLISYKQPCFLCDMFLLQIWAF